MRIIKWDYSKPVSSQYARVDDECQTSRASGLKGAVLARTANKHLDSAGVPWAGGGGARAHSCVRVRVRACACCPTVRRTIRQPRCIVTLCTAPTLSGGVREAECDGQERIVPSAKALPVRSVQSRSRFRQQGDGTARGSGQGGKRSAEAALGRCGCRGTRPTALVGFRKTRPTGVQKANRWKWRRRSDSEGLFGSDLATHAPPKNTAG